MSRTALRSVLELRFPASRLRCLSSRVAAGVRAFNSTSQIVEPNSQADTLPARAIHPIEQPLGRAPTVPTPTRTDALGAAEQRSSVADLLPLLAAQPSRYITIHIHGKPYLVTPGDKIRLPFQMPGVLPGDVLRLNRASVIGSRDFTLKGSPYIDEGLFECRAVVLGTESEPMRIMIKKKRRNRRKKSVRSKHKYTVLRIQELSITGAEANGGSAPEGI